MQSTNSCFRGVYSRFDLGQSAESAMLIASLRDVIRQQSVEIEALQTQLKETKATSNKISDSQVIYIFKLMSNSSLMAIVSTALRPSESSEIVANAA